MIVRRRRALTLLSYGTRLRAANAHTRRPTNQQTRNENAPSALRRWGVELPLDFVWARYRVRPREIPARCFVSEIVHESGTTAATERAASWTKSGCRMHSARLTVRWVMGFVKELADKNCGRRFYKEMRELSTAICSLNAV
jgi:hypothetical protein